MDSRFPKWLRWIVGKLDFLGIPNLGGVVAGTAVLAFIARVMAPDVLHQFIFEPTLVLQGEWWRLFTFIFVGTLTNPIWLLFFVLFTYFVMNSIEQEWGPGPLTVYVLFGYLSCLAGAFITGYPIDIFEFVIQNVGLAFGTLFPEYEISIYLVIPVRAKWIALVTGGFILMQFFRGGEATKINLFFAFLPYIVFFSPLLVRYIKERMRTAENRRRFDKNMWN